MDLLADGVGLQEESLKQDEATRREYVHALRQIQAAEESNSIEQALQAAREHLSMDAVYATSIGTQQQTIDAVAGDVGAMRLAPGLAFPLEQTYCSRMLRGEISRVIPNTSAEPAVQDLAATREIGAYIGIPVTLSDGRVHGTLCCASHNPRPELGTDQLNFLQILADIVARLVERSQRELRARTARL
jgi:GAF domain-containing protein